MDAHNTTFFFEHVANQYGKMGAAVLSVVSIWIHMSSLGRMPQEPIWKAAQS